MRNVLRSAMVIMLAMLAAGTAGFLALMLWSLSSLRLPRARRVTFHGVTTIGDAVNTCQQSGLIGWELAISAQQLAVRTFCYSRRNPWGTPGRAFARGMGYCQQQALALGRIYAGLGIDVQPVYALQCRFPPTTIHGLPESERMSPHSWLRVRISDGDREHPARPAGTAASDRADHAAGAV